MDGFAIAGAAVGVIGGLTGLGSAIVNWRMHRHTVEQDKFEQYCGAYEKRILVLKEIGPPEKLKAAQDDYEQMLEAWQQTQQLAALVPSRMPRWVVPSLSGQEAERVRDLLAGSKKLPPDLLSKHDYVTRGIAYFEIGEHDHAVEAFDRALALGAGCMVDEPVLLLRAVSLSRLGRGTEALADADAALAIMADSNSFEIRAVIRSSLGLNKQALEDLDRSLELNPNNQEAHYNRACLQSTMGLFSEALSDLAVAARSDEKWRRKARADDDFAALRNDPGYGPRFWEMVGGENDSEG